MRAVGQLPAALLVDGHVPGQHGGTGQTAPWELLATFRPGVPLILAGGLTPENVRGGVRHGAALWRRCRKRRGSIAALQGLGQAAAFHRQCARGAGVSAPQVSFALPLAAKRYMRNTPLRLLRSRALIEWRGKPCIPWEAAFAGCAAGATGNSISAAADASDGRDGSSDGGPVASIEYSEVRKGMVIVGEGGQLFYCMDRDLKTPGNLPSKLKLKLRNLKTGLVNDVRSTPKTRWSRRISNPPCNISTRIPTATFSWTTRRSTRRRCRKAWPAT